MAELCDITPMKDVSSSQETPKKFKSRNCIIESNANKAVPQGNNVLDEAGLFAQEITNPTFSMENLNKTLIATSQDFDSEKIQGCDKEELGIDSSPTSQKNKNAKKKEKRKLHLQMPANEHLKNTSSIQTNSTPSLTNSASIQAKSGPVQACYLPVQDNSVSKPANVVTALGNSIPAQANYATAQHSYAATQAKFPAPQVNSAPRHPNYMPVQDNSVPIHASFVRQQIHSAPIQANYAPFMGNFASMHGNSAPLPQNYAPVQSNSPLMKTNFAPAQAKPVQSSSPSMQANFAPAQANFAQEQIKSQQRMPPSHDYIGSVLRNERPPVQEFFMKFITPMYAPTDLRHWPNNKQHPNQPNENISPQQAGSVPSSPSSMTGAPFHSGSYPNSPHMVPEATSPRYIQNAMQHPLLSQSVSSAVYSNWSPPPFNLMRNFWVPYLPVHLLHGQGSALPQQNKKNNGKNGECLLTFDPYLSVEEVEAGLKDNSLIEGVIRINPKQYQHAYISSVDRSEQDIFIDGLKNRNRALEGDVVVIQLLSDSDTEDIDANNVETQKTQDKRKKDNSVTNSETIKKKEDKHEIQNKNDDSNKLLCKILDNNGMQNNKEDKNEAINKTEDNKNIESKIDKNIELKNKKQDINKVMKETENNQNIEDNNGDNKKTADNNEDKKKTENRNETKNRKGKVVFIKEKIHRRTCIGTLKLMTDKNRQKALFVPRDRRIPRLHVPFTSWPNNFHRDAERYENVLFLAMIQDWNISKYALGKILSQIGLSGDMEVERRAILAETDLDVTPFGPEYRHLYPGLDYVIPEEEIKKRLDCRDMCIFSIDPFNCRDIDDAVSCRKLDNGNYEIGVHISDVTHFLTENTKLDEKVAEKATTIYLVEKAYHMLPDELCMLCSLFPGVDKLAFSVFWEMTEDAKIVSHKFSKTVIKSCCQLAYEHAQAVLDEKENAENTFPEFYNNFKYEDVYETIKILGKLSSTLRKNRFDSGALRIDQPKLHFTLSPTDGLPESYEIYLSKQSHQLIEEFMLLANMTVAKRIIDDHPKLAFLRCHPPPSMYMMRQLVNALKPIGIDLDISSAGDLHRSISPYVGPENTDKGKAIVLSMLCAKPMTRAKYFCAGDPENDDYNHYALNVPLYTHFTSPIRRYADIMVHRLLSASLNYRENPQWEIDNVKQVAGQCNKQKYNAKKAGELSTELYILKYIEMHSPMITEAVVVEIREKYIDFIILAMGLNRRMFFSNDFPGKYERIKSEAGSKLAKMEVTWNESNELPSVLQVIEVFSTIKVEMFKEDNAKVGMRLLRPQ